MVRLVKALIRAALVVIALACVFLTALVIFIIGAIALQEPSATAQSCPTDAAPERATRYCWYTDDGPRSYHGTYRALGCGPVRSES